MNKASIGSLRTLVLVQRPDHAVNELGERADPAGQWNDVATFWAAVEPLAGEEKQHAAAAEARSTHRLRLRFTDQVDTTCRFVVGSRVLYAETVADPDGRREWLLVEATEAKPA